MTSYGQKRLALAAASAPHRLHAVSGRFQRSRDTDGHSVTTLLVLYIVYVIYCNKLMITNSLVCVKTSLLQNHVQVKMGNAKKLKYAFKMLTLQIGGDVKSLIP